MEQLRSEPAKIMEKDVDLERQKAFEAQFDKCITEFFGVEKDVLEKLQERVISCNGHVRFFMHPVTLYSSDEEISAGDPDKTIAVFLETLQQNMDNPKKALIIALLDEEHADEAVEDIEKLMGKKMHEMGCLVVRTMSNYGNISNKYFDLFTKYKDIFGLDAIPSAAEAVSTEHANWIFFSSLLRMYGIKSGTCYGGFIGKDDSKIIEDINVSMDRCLGSFIACMRHYGDFKLDISKHVVYKDGLTREGLKEAGGNLKDTGKAGENNKYDI